MAKPRSGSGSIASWAIRIKITDIKPEKRRIVFDKCLFQKSAKSLTWADKRNAYSKILRKLGTFKGQMKAGLPPTKKEREKTIEKARNAAHQILSILDPVSSPHTSTLIRRTMEIDGYNVNQLQNMLEYIEEKPFTDKITRRNNDGKEQTTFVTMPAKSNSYLYDLIYDLTEIWLQITGKTPSLGGGDAGIPKTSAYNEWLKAVLDIVDQKPPRNEVETMVKIFKKTDNIK